MRRHALMVEDDALSNKIDYVTIFQEILNLKGHPHRITSSILRNGWILPIGGVALRRVCVCSLRSRLVKYIWVLQNITCVGGREVVTLNRITHDCPYPSFDKKKGQTVVFSKIKSVWLYSQMENQLLPNCHQIN